jgi:hypothetical protein
MAKDWYDLASYPTLKLMIQGHGFGVSDNFNVDGVLFIKVTK